MINNNFSLIPKLEERVVVEVQYVVEDGRN